MGNYQRLFKYIGIAAVVLLLFGLLGWYFFLRTQTGDIAAIDSARGFSVAVPSFSGSRSSTSENIAGGVGGDSILFTPQTDQRPPRLWKVSQSPIAGMGWLATSSVLRYVERSTGYVYDVDPLGGKIVRRTNTLMPKMYDADILSDGAVVLHTLDELAMQTTFLGKISTTTSEEGYAELEAVSLGNNIRAITPSPVLPEMLVVASSRDGDGTLIRSTSAGDAPQSVMTLPLASLVPLWLADGRMFVSERPVSGISGSAYAVATTTLTPLVRNIPGLVALPRTNSRALIYSSDDGQRLHLFARPSADASLSELSIQTTAAKCVWAPPSTATSSNMTAYCAVPQSAPTAQFTNHWLRGEVHTADAWFTVDVSSANPERFFVPETSVALDVERPMIDVTGEYITFINARDKSLWVLRVRE